MNTFSFAVALKLTPLSTKGNPGRYRMATCLNSTSPFAGQSEGGYKKDTAPVGRPEELIYSTKLITMNRHKVMCLQGRDVRALSSSIDLTPPTC